MGSKGRAQALSPTLSQRERKKQSAFDTEPLAVASGSQANMNNQTHHTSFEMKRWIIWSAVLLTFGLGMSRYPLSTASGTVPSVETIRFQSKLVNTTLPYNVVLPSGYRTSNTTRYPVLYLLHGLGGHYSDWVTRTNVADSAAQYRR